MELDDMVRPILEAKFKLGLFEHPYVDEAKVQPIFDDPSHRAAAKLAAVAPPCFGTIRTPLPLNRTADNKVSVIGPLADSRQDMLGSWTFARTSLRQRRSLQGFGQSRPGAPSRLRAGAEHSPHVVDLRHDAQGKASARQARGAGR